MNIIFAGTPEFAVPALTALIHSTHHIVAVLTQPDKPKGRGLKLTASPVKTLALANQIPVLEPTSLKADTLQQSLADLHADVMVVVAYGLIVPKNVLSIPRLGCINIHPSLLPRFRGAAPIPRTIFAGDKETGVTIMQMDEGLDTGPILSQEKYRLTGEETGATLEADLAKKGADQLLTVLSAFAEIKPIPQSQEGVTYANKMTKEEALIDWKQSAKQLDCKIRAFNPRPVAYTAWQEKTLRIWYAKPIEQTTEAKPGTILRFTRDGLDVAAGQQSILRLLEIQLPGSKKLSIADFYNANHDNFREGQHFS